MRSVIVNEFRAKAFLRQEAEETQRCSVFLATVNSYAARALQIAPAAGVGATRF